MSDGAMTRAQVAELAGVEAAFVDRLCELGILVRAGASFTEGDVRRVRILHALERSGMSIASVGQVVRDGSVDLGFVDDPAYVLFTGLTDATFESASRDRGIPIEILVALREVLGSAAPQPGDRLRAVEMGAIPAIELMVRHGVRTHVIERTIRTYGESLRRMAEVEADWWMSDVIRPILDRGKSVAEVGPESAAFSNALSSLSDQMILAMYHGQQSNAWMTNFFEAFEHALARAGIKQPTERQPAMCFLDLSGYTRLTEERGDEAAADLAARLARLVQRSSTKHSGKPVKWLGDGVMFFFADPGNAVLSALEMVEEAREAALPPAHVGIHAGPVLFQEGDYFGRTVNVASRIADYARQGEVLVSDSVVVATTVEGVRFDPIGPVELKGMTEAIPLSAARRA
jgi:class 3 adenylate cyclase